MNAFVVERRVERFDRGIQAGLLPKADPVIQGLEVSGKMKTAKEVGGDIYDYILTRKEMHDYELFGPDDAGRAPMVSLDGDWRLYEVRSP